MKVRKPYGKNAQTSTRKDHQGKKGLLSGKEIVCGKGEKETKLLILQRERGETERERGERETEREILTASCFPGFCRCPGRRVFAVWSPSSEFCKNPDIDRSFIYFHVIVTLKFG